MVFVKNLNINLNIRIIVDVLKQLKEKALFEYSCYVDKLRNGYKEDYSHILDLICLIELGNQIDNYEFISQYLINNGEI